MEENDDLMKFDKNSSDEEEPVPAKKENEGLFNSRIQYQMKFDKNSSDEEEPMPTRSVNKDLYNNNRMQFSYMKNKNIWR